VKNRIALFLLISLTYSLTAQEVLVKGIVTNKENNPISGVAIMVSNKGTTTNLKGEYSILISKKVKATITFTHISYNILKSEIELNSNEINYSPILTNKIEEINEVSVVNDKKEAEGFISIDKKTVQNIPGANNGVENIIMTLAGVNNNNELSTQYNVRGGNFDENLVYINGIEIYRPFLVRSGQQEGLSFVNSKMVENVNFSAGGFQAKYGDKLSSVLNINYRIPEEFSAEINTSLLGGSATLEGISNNKKLAALVGFRYRNNSLFINSKDIETNANPNFTDVQAYLSYVVNPKLKINFLGNYALNNYNYIPKTRRTKFGTIANPTELIVYYEGNEKDKFKTTFGALKADYLVNENLNISLSNSVYHTIEEEYYDILANYNLGEVNNDFASENFGDVSNIQNIGSQLNHARNDLDALLFNTKINGTYKKDNYQIDFGLKYQNEDFKDRIKEWEVIDSLGFNVRPNHHLLNLQPYEPYEGAIEPYKSIDTKNKVKVDRLIWFVQYSKLVYLNNHKIRYNLGLRSHNWNVNIPNQESVNKIIYSLRSQFSIKPDWEKDMLFKASIGMYNQPPFYKELRNFEGEINADVETQKSIHFVVGNDFSFNLWNRPFKLKTDIYYKILDNINYYTVDNVKVNYSATNNTKGYATGIDLRLNGEFVPGTDSWVSIGFLKTEENIDNKGYISRPTDQRFKFGMLFQDYVPNIPNLKMYLNLVFNSGLPGGAPSYSDPYKYQNRLNSYKRADIGISYIISESQKLKNKIWLQKFKELAVGFEIYNMFDVTNSITNTWVRDSYSKQQFAVPNYMTPRVFNLKLDFKF
jgi:hypothetical protein